MKIKSSIGLTILLHTVLCTLYAVRCTINLNDLYQLNIKYQFLAG
jgi:hypothetical protein